MILLVKNLLETVFMIRKMKIDSKKVYTVTEMI